MKILRCLIGLCCLLIFFGARPSAADVTLPVGSAPEALDFPHFPDRLHTFVWRNWTIIKAERLATLLDTTTENVHQIAESMGLPVSMQPDSETNLDRIYITIIRRNWHLLPYEQLLALLGFTTEELAFSLREDDFLFIKLGSLKPKCEPLKYEPPTPAAQKQAREIKKFVNTLFGDQINEPIEPRFSFIDRLSQLPPDVETPERQSEPRFSPRYIYSYFAPYGDPLLDSELKAYPAGLLKRLAELGVGGVWIHTVLRKMAPSDVFPEFGKNHEIRLKNLRKLVDRAQQYGIGIFLYANEPRAMPDDFFEERESMRGVGEGDYYAMCTSAPEVRQWLRESYAYLFKHVPGLAGVFTITASENLTNCASHGRISDCPRCEKRTPAEIIAEVNATIEDGVHSGNPNAKVIAWDWGWRDEWAEEIIPRLPKETWLMSVSEWSKPIERGGVQTTVGEYSISAVGPGPRATKHWRLAKEAGLNTVAKVQLNNTWELSAVPYIPVLDLVATHCENLLSRDVDGMMMSWTLGGYPSPNLEIVREFDRKPAPSRDAVLAGIAKKYFAENGASSAQEAWRSLSDAFQEFPFHIGVVYKYPGQFGPANLMYARPTGYRATMIGFPYDDLQSWRGPYPEGVFADQFEKLASGWRKGIQKLEKALDQSDSSATQTAKEQLLFARAALDHFSSVKNQVRFTILRNRLLNEEDPLSDKQRNNLVSTMKDILREEIGIARDHYMLTIQDSRIGYEASNHYYYLPIDLIEKAVNCRYILDRAEEIYR